MVVDMDDKRIIKLALSIAEEIISLCAVVLAIGAVKKEKPEVKHRMAIALGCVALSNLVGTLNSCYKN